MKSVPVIEFPAVIDLGEHEQGEIVNSRFTIANRGRGELMIDQIRTSCACAGLEQEMDGKFVRVETLRLGPRKEVELTLRISVRGPAGAPNLNRIWFRTNDESRPEGVIEAVIPKVTGGVTTTPVSVIFGKVTRGDDARQVVDIFDGARQPRMLSRVVSSNPRLASVRLLPTEKDPVKKEDLPLGTRLARVEVLLNTEEPGQVDESFFIYLVGENRPFHTISITGRVSNIVEAMPPSLVLPQYSDRGPINSARCLCRTSKGRPLTLSVESVPSYLRAEVFPVEGNPHMQSVRIEYIPSRRPKLTTESHHPVVRLRVKVGSQVTSLEIPVTLRSEGSS